MSSPITISGTNGIDFTQLLNAVMAQESQPVTDLQSRQSTLSSQKTLFGTLATKLGTLGTATAALSSSDAFNAITAASSDSASVAISSATGTVEGAYDVVVSELARAQVTASQSTYAAPSTVVATGGTLTLATSAGGPITVTLSGSTTLQDLASAINATANTPVRASLVQSAPGSYQLVLTGTASGSANAFTVANGLTGGAGLAFVDTNNDGLSGNSAADNAVTATNAALTVNNIPISSATNTITDAAPGLTLTLLKKDPGSTIRVTAARDATNTRMKVQAFVDGYNALVAFIGSQRTADTNQQTNIARDAMVRSLQNQMRSELLSAHGTGTYTRLASIGLGFDLSGKMTLDSKAFNAAMTADPAAVQGLFSGDGGSEKGAFGAVSSLLTQYTQAGGLIADVEGRIDAQVTSLTKQIDNMNARLAIRRNTLQQEYTAADQAMTQLKNQSASLSAIGTGYSLF